MHVERTAGGDAYRMMELSEGVTRAEWDDVNSLVPVFILNSHVGPCEMLPFIPSVCNQPFEVSERNEGLRRSCTLLNERSDE